MWIVDRDGGSGTWFILGLAAASLWGLARGTEVPLLSLSFGYSSLLWDILCNHFFRIRCGQVGEVPASPLGPPLMLIPSQTPEGSELHLPVL